jgi:hypothetical protein
MTVKLNLTIDENLVTKSKKFARERNTTVSKLVQELLSKHIAPNNKKIQKSDFISRTAGIISVKNYDIKKEKLQLFEKYGL